MRLAIVTVLPTAYRAPLYDEIDRLLRERGGELTVVYSGRRRRGVQWSDDTAPIGRARSIFLNDEPPTLRGRALHANPLVVRALRDARPDVAVLGGYAPWIYLAASWCRLARVPYLIWSGETLRSAETDRSRSRRRQPLWRGASGFLAYGPEAAEYLEDVVVARKPVTIVGNGIDVDGYARLVESERGRRGALRQEYGVDGDIVLSVGGDRKNLDVIVRAVQAMHERVRVVVVGSDPPARRSTRLITLGRRPTDEMPAIYAAADCLAHPTRLDRWPHAINEALAGGLPVVTSPLAGIPAEILAGPGSAMVGIEVGAIARAIEAALAIARNSSPEVREAIRAPLRPWGVDRMAERIVVAAEAARFTHQSTPGARARA